jgi:hypothetical protein
VEERERERERERVMWSRMRTMLRQAKERNVALVFDWLLGAIELPLNMKDRRKNEIGENNKERERERETP